MDAYEELCRQARAKRDRIIDAARHDCQLALRRIKQLHKQVTGAKQMPLGRPQRVSEKTLTDHLYEALPLNKAFTIAECCEWMRDNPATCRYHENSIRGAIRVLSESRRLKRIGRRNGQLLWARADSAVEGGPFGAMTLAEIAESVIQEHGPMRLTEVVAVMKERGYRPEETPRRTAELMRGAVTKTSGRFVKDDKGRWRLAQ